ncbi:hypothetical protein F0562_023895 [Nyssa sinensis]|uniref:Uncharacterized protein n=1 Tax=Nyssa sinensis TaxID=561372 RepID=A0A5J5BHM3_9ASTE|nr:hypothetical protein F0562_023895 [Nyssa sinensis]
MKRTLLINFSLPARNLLLSPPPTMFKPNPNINISLFSLSSTPAKIRLFSSEDDSSTENPKPLSETNLVQSQNKDVSIDVDDVSKQELKKRIEKYFEGDEEAIPSIFEAILKRKLAGKHDETDDELMNEIGDKPFVEDSDEDFDSD